MIAMTKLADDAYEFHYKPEGDSEKTCSICGLSKKRGNMHRAIRLDEEIRGAYVIRRGGQKPDEVVQVHGANRHSPSGRKITRKATGPRRRTLRLLTQAAELNATGKTRRQIATLLGVEVRRIDQLRFQYKALWAVVYTRAMENVRQIVQSMAGTEAASLDPTAFVSMTAAWERTARKDDQPLLRLGASMTLSRFYEEHYLKQCLPGAASTTIAQHRHTLVRWAALTGDPPIAEITNATLCAYRDCISKVRGRREEFLSPNSVRKELRVIQTWLNKAGPAGPRNRDAFGIIEFVPWVRPPKQIFREPRFVTPESLNAVYVAARKMKAPVNSGVSACDWWRALLVLAYNTGLRRGALFSLRLDDVHWDERFLVVKPEPSKTGRGQRVPFNQVVADHLHAIKSVRDLILPWPRHKRKFDSAFHELQSLAGLPEKDQFGLHDLRRTASTVLWEHSPAAAQLMLGHESSSTTTRYYVQQRGILSRAVEGMPQPSAFAAKVGAT
jgi:integrase